jgi:hypothetical protein
MPGLSAVAVDWQSFTGSQFEPFRALCLHHVEGTVKSYTCPRGCGCVHEVIHRHDHTAAIGVCRCKPPECPDIPLSIADITALELTWTRLSRALAQTFDLAPKFLKLPMENTVQFGSWPPEFVPAILTVQCIPAYFSSTIGKLVALLHKPFILFAPTALRLDAMCIAMLENSDSAFFPLDTTTLLKPNGTLLPARPPAELFARFTPKPSTPNKIMSPTPRYMIRKGLGFWRLIFDGQEAILKHERGVYFVAWLLTHPPEHPIHAIDLIAKIPEIYREQLGLPTLVDPTTGKSVTLESGARIQERSLALDDAHAMRALFHKEKELENILDSDASEPVKNEALRELEQIAEFQKHHAGRSKDGAQRAVRSVRMAITRLHENLIEALDHEGHPHPVLRPFAHHLHKHILTPSARHSLTTSRGSRGALAGSFTYEPPGITWAN